MSTHTTKPLVSVVMPVYNTEKYVWEAIQSILDQSFTDFEFVIIDDGSTDDSWEIIQEYAARDQRIRAMQNDGNKWLIWTRNRYLRELSSASTYVWIIDSDDTVSPSRLEIVVDYMQHHDNTAAVWVDLEYIDKDSNILSTYSYPKAKKKLCLCQSPLSHGGALIRKSDRIDVGWYYDMSFKRAHDYELWSRLVWHGKKLHWIHQSLYQYRITGGEQWKKKYLRTTLLNTIRIQKRLKNIYKVKYWRKDKLYHEALIILSWFPDRFIYRLFKIVRGI